MRDGNTPYPVHAAQFSQDELIEVLGENAGTVNNWMHAGYLKAEYVKDPRGGRDRRRFSIMAMARAKIIASCVRDAGLKPSYAAEIADFAAPIINETFERDLAGEPVSVNEKYLVCRLHEGKMHSVPLYRRPKEMFFFTDDPNLNPDAKVVTFPVEACIVVPLTRLFNAVFLPATDLLAKQNRGAVNYGLPGLMWADDAHTTVVGLTPDETKEFRTFLRTGEPGKLRHVPRYMELSEKYERAKVAAAFKELA
jgi:hypothetical protein